MQTFLSIALIKSQVKLKKLILSWSLKPSFYYKVATTLFIDITNLADSGHPGTSMGHMYAYRREATLA